MSDPWSNSEDDNNINNRSTNNIPQPSQWQSLLEIARQNVPEGEPRIHRDLFGIEKESARLSSKHAQHVPSSQMYVRQDIFLI